MGLFQKAPPPPVVNTVVSAETSLRGELTTQRDLELSGRLEGKADCRGTVRIDATGSLSGSIRCGALECSGAAEGEASVHGTAAFAARSSFTGTLSARALRVERGARLEGVFRKTSAGP